MTPMFCPLPPNEPCAGFKGNATMGIRSVTLISDAAAPGPIAWATYSGHRFAEELGVPDDHGNTPKFRREVALLERSPSRLPT